MNFLQKPITKMLAVGALALLLLIPAAMIQNLIQERELTQESAVSEMTGVWGGEQQLLGPYLDIPFDQPYMVTNSDGTEEVSYARKHLYVLPETLRGKVNVLPESRSLGMYEAVVYKGDVNLMGQFEMPNWKQLGVDQSRIHWDKITINVGISDLRGVEGDARFMWDRKELTLNSGLTTRDVFASGVHASIDIKEAQHLEFAFKTKLRGSRRFSVVPLGKSTVFEMNSPWTEPNFEGNFAYSNYEPSDEGFYARWDVSHLNRNFPQAWIGNSFRPQSDYFGTEFIRSVDTYSKAHRVVKYAILIIVLTFLVFFFSELVKGARVNSLQYVLVGLALVLFYTLLLSFSEHIGFNNAYLVATVMTVGMEFLYARSVLKSTALGVYVAGVLSLLYTFIFVLIQLKDFALLTGSLGLFVILGVVMYISRHVKWDAD